MSVKFCKDCKWAHTDKSAAWLLKCSNPQVNAKDGWALGTAGLNIGSECRSEREKTSFFAACGRKGKQYEPVY